MCFGKNVFNLLLPTDNVLANFMKDFTVKALVEKRIEYDVEMHVCFINLEKTVTLIGKCYLRY
mgnify:CR=1 FL=1